MPDIDWTDLAQDTDKWRATVDIVMNLGSHKMRGNFLTSWGTTGLSRRTLLHRELL